MDGVCRTCMGSNKPVRSLFEVDSDLIEFHVKLYTCFPTFNFDDSDFPKTMCAPCIKMLKSAYKFRELCIKSTSAFLKKRKSKAHNATTKKAVKPNKELSTKNEQTPILEVPNVILNNNSNISDQSPNNLNNPGTIEPHLPALNTNNSKDEFDKNNKLGENEKEKDIAQQSTSADLASKEISENTPINTESSVNDKTENTENKNFEVGEARINANKKYMKVYPLKSVENEISDENPQNSQNEKHDTVSVQPPVLNIKGINLAKNKEIQKEMNDKASENLFILQDLNSLDILVKHKNLIQNQVNCLSNSDSTEENDLVVYRIDLVDGDESSSVVQRTESNSNLIPEITNENAEIKSENKNEHESNSLKSQKENLINPASVPESNNKSKEKTNTLKPSEVSDSTNKTKDKESCFNDTVEHETNLQNSLTKNTKETDTNPIPISDSNNEITEENTTPENDTSLLKPLEDYNLNNFIISSLRYNEDIVEKSEKNYEVDLIQEQTEFEEEIEDTVNATDNNKPTAIYDTNNEHGNDFELSANEIELQTNLSEETVHPIPELELETVKNLNEQHLQDNTVVENSGDLESNLAQSLVKDKPKSIITPIPIAKLMKNYRNEFQTDEIDDLVNKHVTEVHDYNNHNDHTYAKKIYIKSDTSHLSDNVKRKRKRKLSVELKETKDLKLSSPKSKEIKPNIISKKQINKSSSKPNNSGKNITKRRSRGKDSNKPIKSLTDTSTETSTEISTEISTGTSTETSTETLTETLAEISTETSTEISTETDSSSNLVQTPNVSSKSVVNKTVGKKQYKTRAGSTSDDTNISKTVEWKVKKVKSKKNKIHPFKLKIKNIAEKSKIPTTKEYKIITRTRKKKSKEAKSKTEPSESKPIRKEPSESKPIRKEPSESKPIRKEPSESKPIRKEPSESKPIRKEPSESKPIRKEPSEPKPIRKEPTEETTEEVPTKKPKIECNKNNETPTSTTKQPDFPPTKVNEVINDDSDLEYPYGCNLCSLRMKSMSNLEAHLATHSNEDTDSKTCKDCDRSFLNIAGYKIHQTRIHKCQSEDSPLKKKHHTCAVCNKVFTSRSNYFTHKKVHK